MSNRKLPPIPPCSVCGERFANVFEATDHLVEEGGEEVFDPKLILPGGYSLMIGSLLRCIYGYANNPEQIARITQSTYATLYAAEISPKGMQNLIEEMVVDEQMSNFNVELKKLLENEPPKNDETGE
jgi:hypothetical protein